MKHLLLFALTISACAAPDDPPVFAPDSRFPAPPTPSPSCANGRHEFVGLNETLVLDLSVPAKSDLTDFTIFLKNGSINPTTCTTPGN